VKSCIFWEALAKDRASEKHLLIAENYQHLLPIQNNVGEDN